jgi:hypothetical protein
VPEISPVLVFKLKPDGKDGDIEYPLALVTPPELVEATIKIGLPAITDCIELDREIEGG